MKATAVSQQEPHAKFIRSPIVDKGANSRRPSLGYLYSEFDIEAELHQLAPPPLSFILFLQAPGVAKMSITYGIVGSSSTLAVIGLCETQPLDTLSSRQLTRAA